MLGAGEQAEELNALQMAARAAVVYVTVVVIVRLAKKRFMGRGSAFDVILAIILGSVVSRAITGNDPLLPALAAAAMLVALHWAFSLLALHWHRFGVAVKGRPRLLVRAGALLDRDMRKEHMTERDLDEALREHGIVDRAQVEEARLERNGEVSVIRAR